MKALNKFNDLIRKKRTEKKLTQQELADKIGITRNYLSDVENGRYNPSFKTAIKFATFLGIDLNLLSIMTEIQDDNEIEQE